MDELRAFLYKDECEMDWDAEGTVVFVELGKRERERRGGSESGGVGKLGLPGPLGDRVRFGKVDWGGGGEGEERMGEKTIGNGGGCSNSFLCNMGTRTTGGSEHGIAKMELGTIAEDDIS